MSIVRDKPNDQVWFNFNTSWSKFKAIKSGQWFININKDFERVFNKVNKFNPIKKYCEINRGYSPTPNDKYITPFPTRRQVIGGEDFGRYLYKISPKYLTNEFNKSRDSIAVTLDKPFIGIQRIRTNSLNFESRWLVCQIFDKGYVPIDSISYLTNNSSYSLNYFLALLNSKLLNKYYKFHYTDKNVKPIYLKELGFAVPTSRQHDTIITTVNEILSLKKENVKNDVTKLEREMDELVYQLYGLTEEEIKIVEGAM